MGQDDDKADPGGADWGAWADAWQELLHQGGGAEAAPWPPLAEALWAAAGNDGADGDGLGEALRSCVQRWHEAMSVGVPTAAGFVQGLRGLLGLRHLHPPRPTPGSGAATPWPRLGPFQHHQARWEAASEALDHHQAALGRYLDEVTRLAEDMIDAFEQALAQSPELDRSDPRVLFDLWSEIAEQRYESQLASDGYAEALAELTNSWAALRLTLQPLVDELLDALGMPSRRSVEETQAALDRLRRRQRADNAALRERIAALEARLGERGPTAGN